MKIAAWIAGVVLGLAALVGILQYIASERVEVIELSTISAAGETKVTRLWLVDYEGKQYLRAGSDSGWYQRLVAQPEVDVSRAGVTAPFRAIPRPALNPEVNRLMHEKYTWGDTLIGYLVGSREGAIPVELEPR